jgi:hypothetical protein
VAGGGWTDVHLHRSPSSHSHDDQATHTPHYRHDVRQLVNTVERNLKKLEDADGGSESASERATVEFDAAALDLEKSSRRSSGRAMGWRWGSGAAIQRLADDNDARRLEGSGRPRGRDGGAGELLRKCYRQIYPHPHQPGVSVEQWAWRV